jgi:putative Mg2+ transporter-C (MgtC) family protein
MTNQYIFQEFKIGDPARMAAQVISGIGFLGAGTIIVTGRHQVKGLTTAAGLWASACMGLAIGIGFYKAAILACVLIAFATIVLHRLDNYMLSKSKIFDIYLEFGNSASITSILEVIKSYKIGIDNIEILKPSYATNASVAAIMTLHLKQKKMRLDVVAKISSIEGVEFLEEI